MPAKESLFDKRTRRNRYNLKKRAGNRLRLSVHRTNKHIYAQLIDDSNGITIASASSQDKELKLNSGSGVEAAVAVGKLVASRAKKAKAGDVVFDRGGFVYHGRVKALADSAREAGLAF